MLVLKSESDESYNEMFFFLLFISASFFPINLPLAPDSVLFTSLYIYSPSRPPQAQKDADAVDKVMKELDENGDGEVDFQEYVVLVAALTVACNNFFWENS